MLVICLIAGLLTGLASALVAFIAGHGIAGVIGFYTLGGALGLCICAGASVALRRSNRDPSHAPQKRTRQRAQENDH